MRIPEDPSPDVMQPWIRLLDTQDKERLARLHKEADRQRYALGHGLLRKALSGLAPKLEPTEWRFTLSDKGRPEIANDGDIGEISFSISYTEGLLGCAVAKRGPLGIDIEKVSDVYPYEEVLEKTLSADERRSLAAAAADNRRERFFEFWTLKESYLKAIGVGLEPDLTSISFSVDGHDSIRATVGEEGPWQFELLVPLPGYRLALTCTSGSDVELNWADP